VLAAALLVVLLIGIPVGLASTIGNLPTAGRRSRPVTCPARS
jgi:hypothetical protein